MFIVYFTFYVIITSDLAITGPLTIFCIQNIEFSFKDNATYVEPFVFRVALFPSVFSSALRLGPIAFSSPLVV